MNSYLKLFLSSALFLLTIISGFAQPIITINDASTNANSEVMVDFVIDNVASVGEIQFSINWDNSQLNFVEVASVNDNIFSGISFDDFDDSDKDNGNLVFHWEEDMPNSVGQVGDGIIMFQLTFNTIGNEGDQIPLSISGDPVEITLMRNQNGSQTDIGGATIINPGTITLIEAIPDVNFTLTPIDEPSVICRGDQLCYNLTTSNFDSILVMQYIITWNGSVLEYNSLSDFGLEDLNKNSFVVKTDDPDTDEIEPTDSVARISWFPNNSIEGLTNGISLPDGSSLATICFDVVGDPNTSTLIEITQDGLTPLDLKDINEVDLDLITTPQSVSITDCASLISFSTSCQDIKFEETVCIDFTTSNFTDINAAKYTVIFNPDVLEFVNTENFGLPNLDASNITANNGVLTFDWTGTSGETLANGARLFSACFKAIGPIDSTSTLQYLNLAGLVIVTNSSGQDFQPQFSDCEIKILPPTVKLTIPELSTPPETDICLEVTVENFINIGHIEMPIEWDPTVIEFVDIRPTGLDGLTRANFSLLDIANGRLELEEWDSPTAEGVTLPDNAEIFEICFRVVGDLGTESPVTFPESTITPVFIQNANNQTLDIESNNGQVTVETSGLVLTSETRVERRDNAFCVDIQTSNFDNIVSAGYAHLYDPEVLRFDSVQVTDAISNLSPTNIVSAAEGTIRVAWTSDDPLNGTTIADGTTIYSLCFTAIGDLGACSNFRLDTIQDITTVESSGDDIGTFNNTKDICIDNFGMTLVDTLRPSCIGGDGQIRLTVSGDPGENFLFFVSKDEAAFITGEDVENDSIILTDLDEGIYSIRINSIVDVSKSEERTFNLTLSEADLPSIDLGENIDAGCVEEGDSINITLDGSNFTLPPTIGSNLFTTEWTTLGIGLLDNSTADNETTTAFAPGRYIFTVRMTDTGCEASDTIDVTVTQSPRVAVNQGGILGCTNSTLQLGLAIDLDLNTNAVYLWTTNDGNIVSGETTFEPIVNQEGIYKFTALDTVNGCLGFDSTFVFVDTIKPEAIAGPDFEMGCDDTFLSILGTGSTGAEVEWSTPDGSSIFYPDPNNQEEANVTRVGTYVFAVTNQVNGCQATDTMMINADNSLPVARAADLAIIGCGADDVKLDGSESSQGAIFSYRWEDPNNQPISTEDTLRTAIEGEYLLIVVNEDNNDCISDTARVMVTIDKTEPQTSITEVLVLACQADCTPLPANVPDGDHFTYSWETTDGVLCGGEDTPTAMVQSVGVYTLIVKDLNNNCESSAASIVSDDGTGVTADPGPPRQLNCINEVVTLDGRGSSITETSVISWKTEDGTEISNEITVDVMAPGEYTLEIMDTETGCNGIGKIMVIENTEKPTAVAGDAPIVTGCVFPTGRRLDGTASDLGDNIAYAWSSTSGIIVGDTSITAPEIASPGIYVLTVTNTSNGCFDIDEVIVQSDVAIPVPNAGEDKELSCDAPEIALAGFSAELPGSTILWSTEDGNITGEVDQLSVSVDAPGTYVLTIESVDGCTQTDEVIVSSSVDAPEADAGQALTITCNNNLTINGTGTVGENISVSWTSVGGNIISGADTYTPEINRGGSYTLSVLNTDNNCETTSLVIVTDSEELPVADAGANQEICTNESILNAVQPTGNYEGNWTTLEKSMVVSPSEANSMVADLTEGTNTYIWTLSNETCGNFSSDTVVINVPTFPIAEDDFFEIQPDQNFNTINLVENDQVNSDMFNINILEQPTTAQLTDVGNGMLEFTSPARYFGTQQFQYEVCSAVCSELCDIANVRVVVLPGADVDTTNTVPNAITPNGDGMNDILLIDELIFDAVDFPQSELIIFNRWGDVVYKASPYNNDWQGTATNGTDLPEGTYYYILRLDIVEGETMKGDITILR